MTGWATVKLGTIANFKNGLNFNNENWGAGLKIIGVSDFKNRMFPDFESLEQINPRGVARDQDLLEQGDVVFVRSNGNRALIGRCLYINELPEPVSHSGFTIRLRFIDKRAIHAPFFVYVFKSDLVRQVLSDFGGGTNINNLNQGILQNLEVPLPSLQVQRKIAAILSAYDDLIANNQRRIALLEFMAEEIYREWFVRMRFPGHESVHTVGFASSRWSRSAIGDLCQIIKRGVTPKYADDADRLVINQKCIRDGRVSLDDARTHDTVVPNEKLLRYGDVLINSTGVGTLGRVAVFDLAVLGATCDTHVTICRAKASGVGTEYLSQTLCALQSYFESMAAGSTGQSELGREVIARTKITLPPDDLRMRFGEIVTPMRKQRRALLDQNVSMAAVRDALLPRLISGKLKVDHLDIQLPPSMREKVTG